MGRKRIYKSEPDMGMSAKFSHADRAIVQAAASVLHCSMTRLMHDATMVIAKRAIDHEVALRQVWGESDGTIEVSPT